MATQEMVLELLLTVKAQEHEDRWTLTSEDFGFSVYGHTKVEAKETFRKGLTTLLNSFGPNTNELRQFLDKQGVKHSLQRLSPYRAQVSQQEFEVAIGASR